MYYLSISGGKHLAGWGPGAKEERFVGRCSGDMHQPPKQVTDYKVHMTKKVSIY